MSTLIVFVALVFALWTAFEVRAWMYWVRKVRQLRSLAPTTQRRKEADHATR